MFVGFLGWGWDGGLGVFWVVFWVVLVLCFCVVFFVVGFGFYVSLGGDLVGFWFWAVGWVVWFDGGYLGILGGRWGWYNMVFCCVWSWWVLFASLLSSLLFSFEICCFWVDLVWVWVLWNLIWVEFEFCLDFGFCCFVF